MFGKKDEQTQEPKYGFRYKFGIRHEGGQGFIIENLDSETEGNQRRDKILLAFRQAIKEEAPIEVDDGLMVNGKDLTWFWVEEVCLQKPYR